MISFLSNLVNGISLGSVYAIIALGYSMVYGIAKMLNFAHGDVIMVGAYICFCGTQYWGLPPVAALLVSILVSTALISMQACHSGGTQASEAAARQIGHLLTR